MTFFTNEDRAAWAHIAILAFCSAVRPDAQSTLYDPLEDVVTDLLCDLMHLVAEEELIAFETLISRARLHFDAETSGGAP